MNGSHRTSRRRPADPERATSPKLATPSRAVHAERLSHSVFGLAALGTAAMFVIEFWTASSADSLALAISAMRSGSEIMVLVAMLTARVWLPARVRHAGLCFDAERTEALIGFVGGCMLLMASVPVAYHAAARLLLPVEYDSDTAVIVLSLGIGVNLAVSALILRRDVGRRSTARASETAGSPAAAKPNADGTLLRPGVRLVVGGQLLDAEVSVVLLLGTAIADLCGWLFVDALAGLAGAFLLSISASKIVLRDGARLIDLRAPAAERRHGTADPTA